MSRGYLREPEMGGQVQEERGRAWEMSQLGTVLVNLAAQGDRSKLIPRRWRR